MKHLIRTIIFMAIAFALVATPLTFAGEGEGADPCMEKSLYERLGGVNSIAVVVDDLLEALYVDSLLNANPAILAARDAIPMAALKFKLTAMVCHATGGPQTYTGRNMKDTHANLNINETEWAEMASVFKGILDKYEVPEKEQGELFAIIGSTKTDIVTAE